MSDAKEFDGLYVVLARIWLKAARRRAAAASVQIILAQRPGLRKRKAKVSRVSHQ